jgi:Domain of unknown function (DUF4334)/GXWXG protein
MGEAVSSRAQVGLRALAGGTTVEDALTFYDSLPPVLVHQMIGPWRGCTLPTGNPFDGLLEALGWHGKTFRGPDDVDPLVFDTTDGAHALNPALVPIAAVLRLRGVLRQPRVASLVRFVMPLGRTSRPTARLRMVEYRGVVTASMCYDRQPINDHFRRVDDDTVLGAMDLRGMAQPFLFVLQREDAGKQGSSRSRVTRGEPSPMPHEKGQP